MQIKARGQQSWMGRRGRAYRWRHWGAGRWTLAAWERGRGPRWGEYGGLRLACIAERAASVAV